MKKLGKLFLSEWYTKIIGIYFTLIIFSLILHSINAGFNPESMHKIFHISIGLLILTFGWNSRIWWKTFPVINGGFFTYIALSGLIFPYFAFPELEAFGLSDTILHGIVGLSGLLIAFLDVKKR